VTKGRRREKTYAGHNGAATDALRALALLAKTPAGQANATSPPSRKAMRRCIDAQICPWCGAGPFLVIALHVNAAHGIDRVELRELLGVTKTAHIADPAHSEERRARLKGIPVPHLKPKGGPRRYSAAGLAVQRAKLDAARSPEQARAAGRAAGDRILQANVTKHQEAQRLFRDTDMTLAQIGGKVSLHPRTVREVLRRAGIEIPDARAERSKRAARMNPDQLARANAAWRAQASTARMALLAEYIAAGSTYGAASALAERHGVSAKSMRARLRAAGAVVPDGRRAPLHPTNRDFNRMDSPS